MRPHSRSSVIGALALAMGLALCVAVTDVSAQIRGVVRGALPPIDAAVQAAVIDSVTKALNETYIFADKAAQIDAALHANFKAGAYGAITDPAEFMERLQTDIKKVHLDLHMKLSALPPAGSPQPQSVGVPFGSDAYRERARRGNYGFKKLEILAGNVGYLKMNQFESTHFAGPTAVGAMAVLANSDALIIDLRHNEGGSPSMIRLLTGYLLKKRTLLISWYNRRLDETTQSWSDDWVPGQTLYDIPVYVLVSSFTGSAAEEFAYDVKNEKRAVIVGEKTGGAAHTVELHTFDVGAFIAWLQLPAGRSISPVTGTNWEMVGVEPDIAVPADEALVAAHLDALKRLEEKAPDDAAKRSIAWAREGLQAAVVPYALPQKALKEYVGEFGTWDIVMDGSRLMLRREKTRKQVLVPMRRDLFAIEALDSKRIRFTRDRSDKIDGLVAVYDTGREEPNPRTK